MLGAVEGLTEFLPVSSTGHLILAAHLLGLHGEAVNTFTVVIQAGALCAVLGLYRARIRLLWRGLIGRDAEGRRLLTNLSASFLPAAAVGWALHRPIKTWLFRPWPVVAALTVGGVVMVGLDRWRRSGRHPAGRVLESLTVRDAIIIGCAQCLSLWPGSSRAMVTMVAGILIGLPVAAALGAPELKPLAVLIDEASRSRTELRPQEVTITRDGRELHLAVMATPLQREDGVAEGVVLVFDDVTPLIRGQKVAAWREVARRLAHEIKNPLTPIQLCAERLRRHFTGASDQTRELVEECTSTIVGEVESLKGLVDEFSQFARMPAPRAVPTDLHALLTDVLALYNGIFPEVDIRRHFEAALPPVSADPEQIRRVLINLVDNAIEAMEQHGTIDIETQHDQLNNLARIIVADHGPGIPEAEREKLFLPYYSTKRRGSGLGLAIVRRIVAEHGGSIDVSDNVPTGTRFAIELPC